MSINKHNRIGKKKTWVNTEVRFQWNELLNRYEQVFSDGYWYKGPLALATTPPTLEVTNWAFYEDGTESGSTIIGSVNTNPTLDVDTNYQIRHGLEETSGNASKNTEGQLQYNHNAGGWNNVNSSSSVVQMVNSANLSDGDDTTQRITSFTFDTENAGIDEVTGISGGSTSDLNNTGFETLHSIQIIGADVSNNDTIVLKIVNSNDGDNDFDVYNQTNPTVTVNKASANPTVDEAESITMAEAQTFASVQAASATESVTVADSPTIIVNGPNYSINEAESITVADSPAITIDAEITAAETITVADVSTAVSVFGISASETTSITDVPTIVIGEVGNLSIDESETISIADSPIVISASAIIATESISVADSLTIISDSAISAVESISVVDAPNAVVVSPGAITVDEAESITISDSPTFTSDMGLNLAESITITDSPTATIGAGGYSIDEAESFSLTDSASICVHNTCQQALLNRIIKLEKKLVLHEAIYHY